MKISGAGSVMASCLLIIAGCSGNTNGLVESNQELRVSYRFVIYANLEEEREGEYSDGKPKRKIVDAFIAGKNASSGGQDDAKHVVVELLLLVTARSCQRPLDLTIDGTGLGAFINYMQGTKMAFQPDFRSQMPITRIEQDLMELARKLGAEKPSVKRGFLWDMPAPKETYATREEPKGTTGAEQGR